MGSTPRRPRSRGGGRRGLPASSCSFALLLSALACSACSLGPVKTLGEIVARTIGNGNEGTGFRRARSHCDSPSPVSKSAGLRVRSATAAPHAECDDRDGAADQCPNDEEQGSEWLARRGKDLDRQRPDRRLSRSV